MSITNNPSGEELCLVDSAPQILYLEKLNISKPLRKRKEIL
jgi:hypothetical protein